MPGCHLGLNQSRRLNVGLGLDRDALVSFDASACCSTVSTCITVSTCMTARYEHLLDELRAVVIGDRPQQIRFRDVTASRSSQRASPMLSI